MMLVLRMMMIMMTIKLMKMTTTIQDGPLSIMERWFLKSDLLCSIGCAHDCGACDGDDYQTGKSIYFDINTTATHEVSS